MPDIHISQFTLVGLVGEFQNKLSPNILGNDIGCGVLTINLHTSNKLKTKEQLNEFFQKLDFQVKNHICLDKSINQHDIDQNILNQSIETINSNYFNSSIKNQQQQIQFQDLNKKFSKISQNYKKSLNSLGTGNHFIELDFSEKTKEFYLLLHSGSRQLGKLVFEKYLKYSSQFQMKNEDFENFLQILLQGQEIQIKSSEYQKFRKFVIQSLKKQNLQNQIEKILKLIKSKDCDSFNTKYCLFDEFLKNYLDDVQTLNTFAQLNRICMFYSLKPILQQYFDQQEIFYDSPHNFIFNNIVHKGSQMCGNNLPVFIPLNARDGTLIVQNNQNIQFAPHGTGRKIPVSQAIKQIDQSEMQQELKDIFVSGNRKTSEAPSAYKDIQQFIDNLQQMGFQIQDHLISLFNVKSCGH